MCGSPGVRRAGGRASDRHRAGPTSRFLTGRFTRRGGSLLRIGVRELPPIDLTGFNPGWGDFEHSWGMSALHDGKPWKEHQYHAEILGRFDHDYLGIHLFIQVWDYAQQSDPDQRWQYILVLHRPNRYVNADGDIEYADWDWVIRTEYETDEARRFPTYAEVGADVDIWLQAPDHLRFIVE
jgi:hypothetical protein